MDKEKFLERIKEIGACENDAERRDKLSNLSDEVVKVFDNEDLLNNKIKNLNDDLDSIKKDYEETQKYNRSLWLKLDAQKKESEVLQDTTGIKQEPEKTYKNYDELAKEFMNK